MTAWEFAIISAKQSYLGGICDIDTLNPFCITPNCHNSAWRDLRIELPHFSWRVSRKFCSPFAPFGLRGVTFFALARAPAGLFDLDL